MGDYSLFTVVAAAVAMVLLGAGLAWLLRARRRHRRQGRADASGAIWPSPPASGGDPPSTPARAPAGCMPADLDRLGKQLAEQQQRQIDVVLGHLEAIDRQVSQIHELLAGERREGLPARPATREPPGFAASQEEPTRDAPADDPVEDSGALTVAAAAPAPRATGLEDAIDEFCAGRMADQQLIDEARRLSLRWGSTLALGAQRTAAVSFETAENRVLVFQKDSRGNDFFLVLRSDAYWSFDLALIFDAHAPGGGAAERSLHTAVRTLRPGLGRLEGTELVVTSAGEVEVCPR
jgi:hypothetical protein